MQKLPPPPPIPLPPGPLGTPNVLTRILSGVFVALNLAMFAAAILGGLELLRIG